MASDVFQGRMEIGIGSTFYSRGWPVTDSETNLGFDMTGWNARCEVRDAYGGNVLVKFHSDRSGHASWPGVITLESVAAGANVILSLDAVTSAALAPISGAVFDLELLEPTTNVPHRIVQGLCFITPEVTTDA